MSTEFEVKLPSVALNRYWGGASKKSCVQVTQYNSNLVRSNYGYHAIQLTKKDAGILGKALLDFSKHKEKDISVTKVLEDWENE